MAINPTLKTTAKTAASFVLALGIATPFVSKLEGRSLMAYLDPVGVPTICNGETKGVQLGQTKTHKECDALLAGSLGAALKHVDKSVRYELSPWQRAGLASFVYNVGEGAFNKSSVLRHINGGDFIAGCYSIQKYTYAGGRDCRLAQNHCTGLVRRRKLETELCMKGSALHDPSF